MDPSTVNIFVVAIAVIAAIQAILLGVMAVAVWQARSQFARTQEKVSRVLDTADAILRDSRANLTQVASDLAAVSSTARSQVERLDLAMADVVDRARLQVIRADELVSRTLDKVEETTEVVQQSVVSPVRQISGVLQGVAVAVDTLFRSGQRRESAQDEQLFI